MLKRGSRLDKCLRCTAVLTYLQIVRTVVTIAIVTEFSIRETVAVPAEEIIRIQSCDAAS